MIVLFNGPRPRTSLSSSEKNVLVTLEPKLRVHPYLKYVCNLNFSRYLKPGTVADIRDDYNLDDTHMNAAGVADLESTSWAAWVNFFRANTAYTAFEIHRSTDGITYSLFDTITDTTLLEKQYAVQAGYYKSHAKLKDGSYTAFSSVAQIAAQAPTANAGADKNLAAGTTSTTVTGSGTAYAGATISGYAWTILSGTGITLSNANTATVTVNSLSNGNSYTLRLTVTDSNGLTGTDDVVISVAAAVARRFLFDLGGDGVRHNAAVSNDGVQTPANPPTLASGAPGVAANGDTWNNVVDFRSTWFTDPVDTAGSALTGMSFAVDKLPAGTYFTGQPGDTGYPFGDSINFGGKQQAVDDYPATAVRDNVFFHTSAGTVTGTLVITSGFQASLKIWGNRDAAGPRVLQTSIDGGTTWQEFESAFNLTYTQGTNYTGLTGTVTILMRVKSGSTFGHISVIELFDVKPI
ncbi:PKD domain-containing protein [Chitinophaga sp. MM2321]|uniref:PKD domain-containing protein n=1 Tax=Chitinophaga sp. MM2321 TaxID=3137178 RepID=UPI0032D5B15A